MKKIKKIEGNFIWHKEEWKDIDLSNLESIRGYVDLRGYEGDLPNLESIGGYAYLQGYKRDLPNLESIGGYTDLEGYKGNLPKLESIGGYAYLQGYKRDLPNLESIGGSAFLQGYKKDLPNLDPETRCCVEYIDKEITIAEYRRIRGFTNHTVVMDGKEIEISEESYNNLKKGFS